MLNTCTYCTPTQTYCTHTHVLHTHTHTHNTHTHQLSSHLAEGSYLNPTFQPLEDISSLELPHSCSNGNEDQLEATQIRAPHKWLCDETLLCLLDPRHEENITAFQERWKRGEVGSCESHVIILGNHVIVIACFCKLCCQPDSG